MSERDTHPRAERLSLWEIEQRLAEAMDAIDEANAENVPVPESAIAVATEYALAAAEKRDRCAYFLRQAKASEAAIDDEIARLTALRDRRKRARESFERVILELMMARGVKRLEGMTSAFAAQQNPAHVACDPDVDMATVRPEHVRVVPERYELDKTAIKRTLAAGEALPYAWMAEGAWRLVVK